MSEDRTLLLLEDEPLILLDLEFAGEDLGCTVLASRNVSEALGFIEAGGAIDVAVLDMSLQAGETCVPVARELERRGIPFILHTGDLDRNDERVRGIEAPLIAKPAAANDVITAALELCDRPDNADRRFAAE